MRQQIPIFKRSFRVSSFVQFLSALSVIFTPVVLYLIHPDTEWYWYLILTGWPLFVLIAGAVITGSTSTREI